VFPVLGVLELGFSFPCAEKNEAFDKKVKARGEDNRIHRGGQRHLLGLQVKSTA
jgi:hypothetical protein